MDRREFIRATSIIGGAYALSGHVAFADAVSSPEPYWLDGPMRWVQLAFVVQYDPDFWLAYVKRIHADRALLSAGGVVAFYPTNIALHHRSDCLGNTNTDFAQRSSFVRWAVRSTARVCGERRQSGSDV